MKPVGQWSDRIERWFFKMQSVSEKKQSESENGYFLTRLDRKRDDDGPSPSFLFQVTSTSDEDEDEDDDGVHDAGNRKENDQRSTKQSKWYADLHLRNCFSDMKPAGQWSDRIERWFFKMQSVSEKKQSESENVYFLTRLDRKRDDDSPSPSFLFQVTSTSDEDEDEDDDGVHDAGNRK
ncbi:hypothetical protein L1987_74088 [Smallanthus sonchifolius]|uniref:Uncharacterized protein n=1 Tax=Smallanthus sonchifolius TaxID=185202 RepID=A0ACB9A196_9ASTR|nr:hypothetical protein L1987_74088 [Smallanthus sonchifolius]